MSSAWRRFSISFALTATGALLSAAAVIALIDPLAISPVRIISDEILPHTDRRFIVPAIVRGHRHDSYIVGTSTVHSLDPKHFEDVFPGRFANLSLWDSTPYEHTQVLRLITREQADVRMIIWGLDLRWCTTSPPPRYSVLAYFPDWLYDDNKWQHFTHALNWSGLERSRRKLQQLLRGKDKRIRNDGYLRNLPPESVYDPTRLRKQVYGAGVPRKLAPLDAPMVEGSPNSGARLPGVSILREAVAGIPLSAKIIFIFMPPHVTLLPPPGSQEDKILEDCKAAIAEIAHRRRSWVLDAMWHNIWTVEDSSFWDPHHFRDHIAESLISSIGSAVNHGAPDPITPIRILARGN